MIAYGIKSILCLCLLWGFYKLFLEKERIHYIKRFYLIFSLLFALVLPMLTFTYEKEILAEPETPIKESIVVPIRPEALQPPFEEVNVVSTMQDFEAFLWGFYIIGVLIFGFRFIRNLRSMLLQIRRHDKLPEPSHVNVLLGKKIIPYTFLNYIFVSKKEFQNNKIPEEVLQHEKTHVLQKHTLDILFVEALQVAFWFNPLFVLLKRAIRLNHEFLADQNVLKQQFSIRNYITLLVSYPNSPNQTELASSINYSLTKKRLQMMTTHFSRKRVALKLCALIPVVMGCILVFNNEIIANEVVKPERTLPDTEVIESKMKEAASSEVVILKETMFQEGISEKDLKAYKKWIKRIKKQRKSGKGVRLQKEEVDRMEALYNAMSGDQRSKVIKLTDLIPPPAAPKVATVAAREVAPPPPPISPDAVVDPEAPEAPEPPEIDPEEIEIDERELERELEQARIEEQVVLEEIEREVAEVMIEAEEARMEAMASMEEDEVQRVLAMEQAQLSREQAERIRLQAMEQAKKARAIAMEAAEMARTEARLHARNAQARAVEEARMAREQAMKAKEMAIKEAHKARKQAHKVRAQAMKEARKAHAKHRQHSSLHLIKQMARNNAEFYYKGKKIDAKRAIEIVRNAGDNLSIDAKTKNGKSKVKIKD